MYTGDLGITEVPTELTPAALPDDLIPTTVVTIQPGEMVFTTPAPLSLPNLANYPPGTEMDLWSINPQTGLFDNVGTGRVTGDGSVIETVSGGIRNSSWHFFTPPPPTDPIADDPDTDPLNPNDACPDMCDAQQDFTSVVQLHSGAVIEWHNLVTYKSLGRERGVRLAYDSLRADPRPIVHFGFRNPPTGGNVFLVASLTARRGDFFTQASAPRNRIDAMTQTQGILSHAPMDLFPGEHVWRVPTGPSQAALQIDLSEQESGVYNYRLRTVFRRPVA